MNICEIAVDVGSYEVCREARSWETQSSHISLRSTTLHLFIFLLLNATAESLAIRMKLSMQYIIP